MPTSTTTFVLAALVATLASASAACASDGLCLFGECRRGARGQDDGDSPQAGEEAAAAPMCTTRGRPHVGLGGIDVAANEEAPEGDRARMKPFSALVTEYRRVLGEGHVPAMLAASGNTFGVASERWSFEPRASAVTIDAAFEIAFRGCTSLVKGDARYAAAPADGTARAECTQWARRFWSREATPAQLDACVAVANETSSWAATCASVLTATPFLTF